MLVLNSCGEVEFRPVEAASPGAGEVRVDVHLTGVEQGLDLAALRAGRESQPGGWGVGKVLEVGRGVCGVRRGEWVHALMAHGARQVLKAENVYPLQWLRKEFAVFVGPGVHALRCVHAANIRYGDRAAIFGMGAVGLMALQFATLNGASEIIALDAHQPRLRIAQRLGAHGVLQLEEPCLFRDDMLQMDAVVELSGHDDALRAALANVRKGGTFVAGGAGYSSEALGQTADAAQQQSVQFISSIESTSEDRIEDRVIRSLDNQQVIVWPIISHILPISDAPAAYHSIQQNPETYIKVLFQYEGFFSR
ncbi:MAG: zinc-binding alcohol dehydrogenase [Candidatus Hinthialibacter antarcticus]|nr:zinc-binding alcohol dehydrogenase [Candidatus Hinthialibacter antarcticus]